MGLINQSPEVQPNSHNNSILQETTLQRQGFSERLQAHLMSLLRILTKSLGK